MNLPHDFAVIRRRQRERQPVFRRLRLIKRPDERAHADRRSRQTRVGGRSALHPPTRQGPPRRRADIPSTASPLFFSGSSRRPPASLRQICRPPRRLRKPSVCSAVCSARVPLRCCPCAASVTGEAAFPPRVFPSSSCVS